MDIHQILKQLPHRYPFVLVDRITEIEKGKFIKGYKNVSINEPFFVGHFPYHPVMPGVLIVEALAQTAALLGFDTLGVTPDDKTLFYFASIDGVRFKNLFHLVISCGWKCVLIGFAQACGNSKDKRLWMAKL